MARCSSRSTRTIARRRTRSRRSTSRSAAGTTSRSSTPRAASGTSSSASSSSRRPRRRTPSAKISPPLQDRRALGDEEAEARSRGEGVREGPRARRRQPPGGRSAHPDLRGGEQRQGARRTPSRSSSDTSKIRRPSSSSTARWRPSTRARSGPAEGVRPLPGRRSSSAPGDARTSEDLERAAKVTGRWDEVVAAYRAGDRAGGRDGDRDARHRAAPAPRARSRRERAEDRRGARRIPRRLRGRRRERRGDRRARAALPPDVALRRAPRHLREEARSLDDCRTRRRRSTHEIAKLYENEIKDVDRRDRHVRASARRRARATRRRWPRSTCSTAVSGDGSPTSRSCVGGSSSTSARRSSSISSSASARPSRSTSPMPAGALENYREILFVDPRHEGARAALEAMLEGRPARGGGVDPRVHLRGARRLAEAHPRARDPQPARRPTSRSASRSKRKAARDQRRARERRRARVRRPRLGAARRSRPRRDARRDRAHRRRFRRPGRARRALRRTRREPDRRGARARLLDAHRRHRRPPRRGRRGRAGVLQGARASTRQTPRRSPRSSSSSPGPQRWTGSHRRRRAPHRAGERRPRARGALRHAWRRSTTSGSGVPRTRSRRTRRCSSSSRRATRALRALDALFTRQKMWSELAENLEAQLALAADDEAQLALMLRLAALRESEMGLVDVAIEGYRQVLERDADERPGPRRARAPRPRREVRARDRRPPRAALPARSATGRSSSARTKCRSGEAKTSTRRVELLHQIAQLYEDAAGDLSAGVRHARSRAEGRPGERGDAGSSSIASPAPPVASTTSRSVFEDARRRDRRSDARQRALHDERPRLRERISATSTRRSPFTGKVLEIDPLNLAAAESLERLFRASSGTPELSIILQRKSEILEEPASKKDALFQAALIEEDVLESPRGGDRRLQQGPRDRRRRPARDRRAHRALPRSVALARPPRGLREEGRSRRRRRGEEAHLLPGRRRLRARARRRAVAPSTRTRRSSSSIRTTSRRSRASTCSTSAPRTGPSSSSCSRARAR